MRLQWRIDNLDQGPLRDMLKLQQQSPDGVLPVLKVRLRRSLLNGEDGQQPDPEGRLDWLEQRIKEMEKEVRVGEERSDELKTRVLNIDVQPF